MDCIEKAKSLYGDAFDYSKVTSIKNTSSKVDIRCVKHNRTFTQRIASHLKGMIGCEDCIAEKRESERLEQQNKLIAEAIGKFGDKFDYSQVVYEKSSKKVKIRCVKHDNVFEQVLSSHIQGYHGCPDCKSEHKKSDAYASIRDSKESFIKKAKDVHGDNYDYSQVDYEKSNKPVKIRCVKHDEWFEQMPVTHLQGFGKCPKCFKEKMCENIMLSTDEYIQKAKCVHGDKYDYSKTVFKGSHEYVTITCPYHGDFNQVAHYHTTGGNGCPACGNINRFGPSSAEKEILEFVKELDPDAIGSDRSLIYPKELDILSHKYKFAIEFNGLYWHSSDSKETDLEKSKYHLDKTKDVEEKGYTLFHIFENEWAEKKDIVKSMIRSRMSQSERVYARKCQVVELKSSDAMDFFEDNHLQGKCGGKTFALLFEGEIVAAMSFGKCRYSDADYEILRYCNKIGYNVVGGASKLFSHINKQHPGKYVSYANRRWSVGNLYEKLGFRFSHDSQPCYWYIKNGKMWHRSRFMKHMLKDRLDDFDPSKSEVENMYANKYRRIWDCGNKVYFYES